MAVDYGRKYTCYSCAAKFYDLSKPKAVCPKCGADQADAPEPEPEEKKIPIGKSPVKTVPLDEKPPKKKFATDDDDADSDDVEEDEDFEEEEDFDEEEDELE